MAHRDVLQPSAPGALRDASCARRDDGRATTCAATHASDGAAHGRCRRCRRASPMMPGMVGHGAQRTQPFLPAALRRRPARAFDAASAERRHDRTRVWRGHRDDRRKAGRRSSRYNGSVPGPLIDVQQGATLNVAISKLARRADGSIHWHGVRLDNPFDGAVGLTQPQVAPRRLVPLRAPLSRPGIYWYHPHVREDLQQSLGLYGNMLVRSTDPAYFSPVNREEVSDAVRSARRRRRARRHSARTSPTHALMGRFGNVMLVNGEPALPARREARRGRAFLPDATRRAARIYNLSFGGARMKLVAGEAGSSSARNWSQSVVIGPAERYVVDVEFARTGKRGAGESRAGARSHDRRRIRPRSTRSASIRRGAGRRRRPAYAPQFATLRRNRRRRGVACRVSRGIRPSRGSRARPHARNQESARRPSRTC